MLRKHQHFYLRGLPILLAGGLACLFGLWSWTSLAAAGLTATPTNPRQNETVTLVGTGFAPGEIVSVWITYPDFSVFGVAELTTNDDGSFDYPYLPDFLGATFTPTGRYTYTAFGQSSGREVYASIDVSIGAAPGPSPTVSLAVEPGRDSQGSYFIFRGSGYGSEEEVAIWLRYPDNTVEDLGRKQTGPGGSFEYLLYAGGAPVGHYALTAYGLTSASNGIAEFDLRADDLVIASGAALLQVGPTPDQQRSYASFAGSGFAPGEIVTIWATLPDGSTYWVGDVLIDDNGGFAAMLYLSEQEPVGQRSFTAYGNSSGLRAVTSYTLTPGNGLWNNPMPILEPDAVCEGLGCS